MVKLSLRLINEAQSVYGSTPLVDLGRFFSLLIYTQSIWLAGGSARRKVATYTQDNANTDIHVLSGIRTYDSNVRATEDGLCLRPRDHCDRQWSTMEKILGSGSIIPSFLTSALDEWWVVSFTSRVKNPRTRRIGGWLGPRAGLDAVE
jgi:hypothetical protein